MIYFCSFLSQVTEEVLSVLRLLSPLTEPESGPLEPSHGGNQLDAALAQLQNVARKLAFSHTTQVNTHTQIKLLIAFLQSQFEFILVGLLEECLLCTFQ